MKEITIYGDNSQTRNFCHVSDSIEVTVKIFETNLYVNDVANIDNDIVITVLELAQTIISLTNSKSNIIHLP